MLIVIGIGALFLWRIFRLVPAKYIGTYLTVFTALYVVGLFLMGNPISYVVAQVIAIAIAAAIIFGGALLLTRGDA